MRHKIKVIKQKQLNLHLDQIQDQIQTHLHIPARPFWQYCHERERKDKLEQLEKLRSSNRQLQTQHEQISVWWPSKFHMGFSKKHQWSYRMILLLLCWWLQHFIYQAANPWHTDMTWMGKICWCHSTFDGHHQKPTVETKWTNNYIGPIVSSMHKGKWTLTLYFDQQLRQQLKDEHHRISEAKQTLNPSGKNKTSVYERCLALPG